jgi:hypothetical protein
MKLKSVLITGSVIAVVITAGVWELYHEHILSFYQEVLVSSGMTLKPQWMEVKPERPMKTVADRNVLLIEMPGLLFDQDKSAHFLLADGTRFEVEAYLTTDKGEKVDLDDISVLGHHDKNYLYLCSNGLQWAKRDYHFRSVTLRSSGMVTTGRVAWVSFDPLTTKDGHAFPDLLMEAPKGK